jgi:hypothetical protein
MIAISNRFFDRSLVENGPRNSFAVRVKCFVPFAQILEYFTIKWFKTSLDMFKKIKLHLFASLFSNKFELVQNMFRHV